MMEIEIGDVDTQPKRGPGRPRKDGSPAQPRRPRKSTAEAKRQALDVCVAAIAMAQVATVSVSTALLNTTIPPDDLLTEDEMVALGDAISAEMLASVRARKWLDRAVKVSPHLALMQTLFMLAVPRLQRHNLIPSGVPNGEQTEPTVSMETGGTPSDSGRYRQWQDNASANTFDALGIHDSVTIETR